MKYYEAMSILSLVIMGLFLFTEDMMFLILWFFLVFALFIDFFYFVCLMKSSERALEKFYGDNENV